MTSVVLWVPNMGWKAASSSIMPDPLSFWLLSVWSYSVPALGGRPAGHLNGHAVSSMKSEFLCVSPSTGTASRSIS